MLLEGKIIFVSGIGPGLGLKLAVHAAREGAAGVIVTARTQSKIDEVEQAVTAEGVPVLPIICDIRDEAQCDNAAATAIAQFGRVDALVNNGYFHGPMDDDIVNRHYARWAEHFETNVIGTMKMSMALVPQMRKQGGGSIVMISTMGTKTVPPMPEAGYCASKSALWNMSKKLAMEVGPDQIRVNSFHPGWMWGATVRNVLATEEQRAVWGNEEEAFRTISANFALRRIATDDECARAALFLASDYS